MYDYIIIGAGISGLFMGHLIKKYNSNFIIIEKSDYIGGRVAVDSIENNTFSIGAGVVRDTDNLIINLYEELTEEELVFFEHRINYVFVKNGQTILPLLIDLLKIKAKKLTKIDRSRLTFKEFARKYISEEEYQIFQESSEDQDFNNADIIDTLYDYNFADNVPGQLISTPNYQLLITKFYNKHKHGIMLNSEVTKIEKNKVYVNNYILETKKIILAVTVDNIQKLLSPLMNNKMIDDIYNNNYNDIYNDIASQPFIRVFAILNKKLPVKPGETLFSRENPLQKLIPINVKKKLYMISYADDIRAQFVNKQTQQDIQKILQVIFKIPDLLILEMKKYYWSEGTHYYKPLPIKYKNRSHFLQIAKNPIKDIHVIGEMVSKDQGWVEGALTSVSDIFSSIYVSEN